MALMDALNESDLMDESESDSSWDSTITSVPQVILPATLFTRRWSHSKKPFLAGRNPDRFA